MISLQLAELICPSRAFSMLAGAIQEAQLQSLADNVMRWGKANLVNWKIKR